MTREQMIDEAVRHVLSRGLSRFTYPVGGHPFLSPIRETFASIHAPEALGLGGDGDWFKIARDNQTTDELGDRHATGSH